MFTRGCQPVSSCWGVGWRRFGGVYSRVRKKKNPNPGELTQANQCVKLWQIKQTKELDEAVMSQFDKREQMIFNNPPHPPHC